ncbi:hypothetical protein [Pseudonocardia sp. TRM90224]|uniref:hypothetical protein n=1 Tax=Pseudonocardia sp. TRM90224 TaxID=2812678 RepID=UPI001E57B353|nr:hypothetical protein [Pseudonocardia sp. TRM90224]
MTVLDHSPRTTYAPRLHRRHEIIVTGGMAGVLRVGEALSGCGYPVRDFAVDVRDGVPYASVTCTVALTTTESDSFCEDIGAVQDVVSVEPR